jgi:transcriptional regulator with XRE-family HTH domain/anti-sigma regulatory factor (Ser/Thr protein kinase)
MTMPANVIPLGARLKQRREQLGLTQAEAARELEVARTAYRLWEMEAARPSPDRWRAIAKWLGLSVTAMLHAAELVDEQDALAVTRATTAAGLTGEAWDASSDASEGDFFSQERSMIADQTRLGGISAEQAAGMRRLLARLQEATAGHAVGEWHPGDFRKRFPPTPLAPAMARAALATTAIGIPNEVLENASLLTSELVTNAVRHASSDWIEVAITLTADRLRVSVSDQDPRPIKPGSSDAEGGGWGLRLVAELATRWGSERNPGGKTIWIEFDLDKPGTP